MANTIGTAYIQIEPTTKGISGSISNALEPEAESAGKSVGGKLSAALGTAAKVGVTAIAGATAAVGAFGKSSIEAGQAFDSSMSQVAATMGFSTAELADTTSEASKSFQQLRDFAQEMGSTTAFSASEAADALNYMALAGYDADTSMEMLPNVLNLAAAGGIDLASASDMVTDAQSALGLSIGQTQQMVDDMAKASSKSNTSVAQLGEAFLTVGANAKSLKGGTSELSTVLGLLADNGIKGAEGGTHLRNILLALNPQTKDAANAWKMLGVSGYDANGNLKPLEQTFQELNAALDGMSEQDRNTYITAMFNKTDLASVNALLSTSSERWKQLGDDIYWSAGAAQNMADVQLDNLSGDITLFQSALEGAKIAVSDGLTPTFRDFVQFGGEGLGKLTEAFKEGGLTGAMDELGNLLSEFLAMIIDKIPEITKAAISLISAFGKGLLDNLPMIAKAGLEIILQIATSIGESLPELIPAIVDTVMAIFDGLIDNIDLLIDAGIELIIGLALGLVEAIPKLIEKTPEIIMKLVEAFIRNAPKLLAAALELIIALANGLIKALPDLLLRVPQIISAIVKGLILGIKDIMAVGKDIVGGLWEGIKGQWNKLVENVLGLGKNLVDKLKGLFQIGSPSKLFRDEVGQWIPAGIAVGIEGNTDVLEDSMKTMQSVMMPDQLDFASSYSVNYDPTSGNDGILALLNEYLPQLANMQMVTETGAMVGALAPKMDQELGRMASMRSRYI